MKKLKIVLFVGAILILFALILWAAHGGQIFTKTQVLVEKQDELFGTTYKEWEDKVVIGLDYAGGFSAIVGVLTGIILFIFRNKKSKEI